jgi:hypothetical protein
MIKERGVKYSDEEIKFKNENRTRCGCLKKMQQIDAENKKQKG